MSTRNHVTQAVRLDQFDAVAKTAATLEHQLRTLMEMVSRARSEERAHGMKTGLVHSLRWWEVALRTHHAQVHDLLTTLECVERV